MQLSTVTALCNAGPAQALTEGQGKTVAGSKRSTKAVQSELLATLQDLMPSNKRQQVNRPHASSSHLHTQPPQTLYTYIVKVGCTYSALDHPTSTVAWEQKSAMQFKGGLKLKCAHV